MKGIRQGSGTVVTGRPRLRGGGAERAFTLVEVVLAVGIATAMLGVVLFFYHQAERFRSGVAAEFERLAAVRQVMQRLVLELGCLVPEAGPLRGEAGQIEFVFAQGGGWAHGDAGLRRVRYLLPEAEDPESPPPSLQRTETPVALGAGDSESSGAELPPDAADGVVTFGELLEAGRTNVPVEPGVSVLTGLRRFQLRYWDGSGWVQRWSAPEPPLAVEVTLGFDPPIDSGGAEEEGATEIFRRLIPVWATGRPTLALPTDQGGARTNAAGAEEAALRAPEEEGLMSGSGGTLERAGGPPTGVGRQPPVDEGGFERSAGSERRRLRRGGFRP